MTRMGLYDKITLSKPRTRTMKDSQPSVIHRRNYAVPPYLFEETDLHVDIHELSTVVTAT